ncbi:CASP8 and FADD-like apoptosis regulator a isoform X2 [Stegostoma tigrinum]|uniref:CASP8 and FADD-like apoptosis regulator a isoform X2 n=1 Tax=Stegostoma tigrinum TaxID=3053191 RepID=UPI00287059B6|nr:CASP8 and FADD-like apoptosis regulator a isoform X2 [Stegostoma tigrinum]
MFKQCTQDIRPLALQIADKLSKDESATLVFLCFDVLKDYLNTGEVKELFDILSKRNLLRTELLNELLYRIKRFDVLKGLQVDVERLQTRLNSGKGYVTSYRQLLIDISENLSQEDLQSIFFLLRCQVPRGHQEAMKTFLDLIVELEKLGKVDANNLELVEDCLKTIGRIDLRKKVSKYKQVALGVHSVQNSTAYQNVVPVAAPCREHGSGREPFEQNQESNWMPASASCNASQLSRQHVQSNCPTSLAASFEEQQSESMINPTVEFVQPPAAASAARQLCSVLQNGLEVYRVQSRPLGLCLIIDCIGTDADLLKETFEVLRFRVITHLYVELDHLKQILQETSQREDLATLDCFVCCIVSRGMTGSILAINGRSPGLLFEEIQQYFKGMSCRALVGKPRLFFVQDFLTASPDPDEVLETDAAQGNGEAVQADGRAWEEVIPQEADILWCCCRVSEHLILQAGQQPSAFMRTLSEYLREHRRSDLISMLTEVNRQTMLRNRLLAFEEPVPLVLRHTLRKKLILP